MDYKLILGITSSILAILLFIPYLQDIFKGKTQPHIYTWLIWTILQAIGVVASLRGGAGYGSWALAVGAVFCGIIFLLSFKYGTKNIQKIDTVCLCLALVACVIYLLVNDPLYSVLIVTATDAIGYYPTMRKAYQEPYSETISTYGLSAFVNLLSIFALSSYNLTTVTYIGSLVLSNSILVTITLYSRSRLQTTTPPHLPDVQ